MRTTVRIDDQILQAAKKAALDRRISLTRLIEEALQDKLAHPYKGGHAEISLVTFRGDGLQAGVDLDDSASLVEVMEK